MADETEVGPHACSSCYVLDGGFTERDSGRKVCTECGGTVLDFKELVDTLADRDSEIRSLEVIRESWEQQHSDDEDEEYDDE
jgi:hypothetical protein